MADTQTISALADLTPEAISKAILSLNPERKAAILAAAAQAGISTGSQNLERLRDGSIRIMITLPPEAAEPLASWAETAGEDLFTFIHQQVVTAATGYIFQDYGGGEMATTAKEALPTAAVATTTTTTAA